MTTNLNTIGLIPLSQPYNSSPWNYTGTESVPSIPNAEITDWIMVEFRDTTDAALATSSTIIEQQAAFLLKDGSVVSLDGSSLLSLSSMPLYQLFAVIYHRNHMEIISANPLSINGSIYSYDFTNSALSVFGGADAHSEISLEVWGMAGSDGNADGEVDINDKYSVWLIQAGLQGYLSGDFNLNSEVENNDKNDLWILNLNKNSIIPD